MVDSINFSHVNFKGSTNLIEQFKAKQTNPQESAGSAPQTTSTFGAEAMAAYNKASLTPQNPAEPAFDTSEFDIKPSEIKQIDKDFIANFKGDKVMTSVGTTAYYEEKNGDISKLYFVHPETNAVSSAVELNNKTGKIITKASYNDDGKCFNVEEYSPNTGMRTKVTFFDKDTQKPDLIASYDENGKFLQNVVYDKDGKIERVLKADNGIDGGAEVVYEFENGLPKTKYTRTKDGIPLETTLFVKGKEAKTIKNLNVPVINHTDVDLSKIDIAPLEVGNLETDISKVNGEKKFRSNNTLEEIRVKDGNKENVYTMDSTGNRLVEIAEFENNKMIRTVRFNDENGKLDVISKYDDNGLEKMTYFDKEGVLEGVEEYETENGSLASKSLYFYPDGKIKGHDIIDKEGHLQNSFHWDKQGNLLEAHEYDKDGKCIDRYYDDAVLKSENSTEDPKNSEKVDSFKKRLNDDNWTKEYRPGTNTIFMKQKNIIDGLEYEIFANGTVREIGCWVKSNVIMNSNQEMIDFFKANKQ